MQSVSPDYKARKQGKPTMPLKERLYSKIKINEYTGLLGVARSFTKRIWENNYRKQN